MWVQSCRMWSWSVFTATKRSCWLTVKMRWKVSGYYMHTAVLHAYTVPSTMACVMNFCKERRWSLSTFAASLFTGKEKCRVFTKSADLRVGFVTCQCLLPKGKHTFKFNISAIQMLYTAYIYIQFWASSVFPSIQPPYTQYETVMSMVEN